MLAGFHPLVASWFEARFGTPSEPQARGWPLIQAGRDVLIAAPTGSGKTLAAFLACLDRLIRRGLAGALEDRTEVVYVSPLKALGNDIHKNLEEPLAELRERARASGLGLPEIRVAVRTGDTPQRERQAMLRRPPHILITTPESLYLLLTAERGRALLRDVHTVIVDEIHAMARDKRGAHLALSLERLEALAAARPARIGLSATQNPIEEIARFLVGEGRPDCAIVDAGRRRALDLAVEVPKDELSAVASKELWGEIHDRVAQLIREHRTTLVFVNTRRMVERVSHALEERLGVGAVAAHHGSLARARRFEAEERLKRGEIKAVVATASLELGIDVGAVELACQLGSPRSFAVGLQRIGRSGHWRGATPKGRLFPATRDEMVECAAFIRGLRRGRLELTRIPPHPLDVLAQQIAAIAACEDVDEDRLFALCRRAYPYGDLDRGDFDAVVAMLSEGVAARRGRSSALLHRDAVHRRLKGRRGTRLAALTSGGAIPDNANYAVVAEPENATVGTVDEDFAVESMAGDVFLLGNTSWRIRRVEAGTVRVEDAHGAPPSVPFWNGEAPGRSAELSEEVSRLREEIEPLLGDRAAAAAWLEREAGVPRAGAEQAAGYLAAGRAALGALPTQKALVAERFFDEAGGMQLVLHAPFGMRVNRAFGMALRKRFCRTFDFELQAAATDDGVLLSLGPQHSFPLESIFELLSEGSLLEVLTQAALQAPMFGVRWRWNATRSLAVLRHQGGRRVPPPILRMRTDDLLAAVFPAQVACQDNALPGPIEVPDHPLVKETLRDCLHEAMDFPGLAALVRRIRSGEVRLLAREAPEPSPLSHEILNSHPYSYLDDAPLEERRARAVITRRALDPARAEDLGALDPQAIREVRRQAWPEPRDADEVHDALLTLCVLPDEAGQGWSALLEELVAAGRAVRMGVGGRAAWVAAERVAIARRAFPRAGFAPRPSFTQADVPADEAILAIVRGWVGCSGPISADALAQRVGLEPTKVDEALLRLEVDGLVLRGRFTSGANEVEWCERSLLARIHRLTLGRLRREIEPVSPADLMRFLLRWQHVHPGTQLHGVRGLAEVIGQIEGFQAPAAAWERDILPARVAGYRPAWLDELCLRGEVVWGRLAGPRPGPGRIRRAGPTRALPITLALRTDLPWLLEAPAEPPAASLGGAAAALRELLQRRGASFWSELLAAGHRLPSELEGSLRELVAAGEVTCDGFSGLRALLAPARRWERHSERLTGGGRWSVLRPAEVEPAREDDLGRVADLFLRRYGLVFRDILMREQGGPSWRELLAIYRRREARGEVRGGRFVTGFSGEQFALPQAVEALRAVRRSPGGERVRLSAADPLNLAGVLTPGPRVPATLGLRLELRDGVPADSAGRSLRA